MDDLGVMSKVGRVFTPPDVIAKKIERFKDIYGTLSRLAEKRTAKSPKAFRNPKSEISFGKRWVESR